MKENNLRRSRMAYMGRCERMGVYPSERAKATQAATSEEIGLLRQGMGDCIDRQAAIAAVMEVVERNRDDQFGGVLLHYTGIKAMLECIPAADVRPLVRGEWIPQDKQSGGVPFECSVCGEVTRETVMGKPRFRYCPCCGAEMLKNAES